MPNLPRPHFNKLSPQTDSVRDECLRNGQLGIAEKPDAIARQDCAGLTRRRFLRVATLAAGGTTVGGVLARPSLAARAATIVPNTAVIQIFCGGGPSQIDMYDLKGNAPAEIRGEFSAISTNVAGIQISEHLPLQAQVADKLAVVRTITHTNSSHLPSSHLVLTGYEPALPPKDNLNPFAGAVASKLHGANQPGLPAYVAVPKRVSYGTAAYLGAAYNPFTTQKYPNAKDFHVPNLKLAGGVTSGRLSQRGALLSKLDRMRRDIDLHGDLLGLDDFTREAMELITSDKAARAFDVSREDPKLRDQYGWDAIGQNCLVARRLVEAGVTYVTCLSGGGWDTHKNNFSRLKSEALPRYDRAIAALVSDIYQRGLAERVLVVAFGEFGRTPRVNRDAGRDHWPGASCVLFSGGGLKVGQMVGSTDKQGAYPASNPYSPGCVLATIYRHLGIDYHHVFHDQNNRPMPVLYSGHPIDELL